MTQHIIYGEGAPTVTPDFEGQHYVDTATKSMYTAKGTASSADFVLPAAPTAYSRYNATPSKDILIVPENVAGFASATKDLGLTFTDFNIGRNASEYLTIDNDIMISLDSLTGTIQMYASVDGGATWQLVDAGYTHSTGTPTEYTVAAARDDDSSKLMIASTTNAEFWRSTNGGTSWSSFTPTGISGSTQRYRLISVSGEWYLDTADKIYSSSDNGDNWQLLHTTFSNYPKEIEIIGNYLYFVEELSGNAGHVIKRLDLRNNSVSTIQQITTGFATEGNFFGFQDRGKYYVHQTTGVLHVVYLDGDKVDTVLLNNYQASDALVGNGTLKRRAFWSDTDRDYIILRDELLYSLPGYHAYQKVYTMPTIPPAENYRFFAISSGVLP